MAQIHSALQKMGIAGGGLFSLGIIVTLSALTWAFRARRHRAGRSLEQTA